MPSLFFGVLFFGELSSDKLISVYLFIHFAVVRFFLFLIVKSLLEFLSVGVSLYAHFRNLQQTIYKVIFILHT